MQYADLVIKSNAIFTGLAENTFAGGLAIKGNHILAVGRDDEIDPLIECSTTVYHYGDRMIMPGFVDAHVHFFLAALAASEHMTTDISASTSEADCVQIMADYASTHPDEPRLCGIGWYPSNWGDAPLPTKESLDNAFPDKPAYLICADAHTAWLNSRALEECGITKDTKVENGEVCLDEYGNPNGILKEAAGFMAFGQMLNLPMDIIKEIQKDFLREASKAGITSISDMSAYALTRETEQLYLACKELEEEDNLDVRLHLYPTLGTEADYETIVQFKKKLDTDKVKLAGLKDFIDGVTSTYTGFLLNPYSDQDINASPNHTQTTYETCVIAANKAGLGVRFHCIADGSVRLALDVFETANHAIDNIGNHRQIRNSIEHCENIHPDDLPRFAELGVVASMQPYHLTLDNNEKIVRIGKDRCRYEWPHRSLLDAGAKLAFGSDYPVVDFNPFLGIYAAVTRQDDKAQPTGCNPQEKIRLAEALKAYTMGSSYVYGRNAELGTLERGKLADVVVLSQNLFAIPQEQIKSCDIEMTIMDGRVVYKKEK